MKILFISNSIGGLRSFRYELIKSLVDRNDSVYIASNIEEAPIVFTELGCKIYSTPMNLRGTDPVADMKLLYAYVKLMREIKPDVVLTYTIKPNVYGGMACRLLRIPQIASITGLGTAFEGRGMLPKIASRLYRMGLKRAKYIFFQNQESMDIFIEKRIVAGRNMAVIPGSGVNLEKYRFIEYPDPAGTTEFLFVGKTRREKGIDHYLDAAVALKPIYPDCKFHLVGPCEEGYDDTIRDLHDRGIVVFHGYQTNTIPYVAASSCNVLPSYHEGMSNSLLESSACGRPAIASNISGCREIVENGRTGYLVNPKDSADLIEKMKAFILLPYEAKKAMGEAAHDKVKAEFDRKFIVNQYIARIDEFAR